MVNILLHMGGDLVSLYFIGVDDAEDYYVGEPIFLVPTFVKHIL
jgi:hypothetical protein